MALATRNSILQRRAGGLGDLASYQLNSEGLSIPEVIAGGLLRVNCSHQIGIATSTEVGLAMARYPIMVVIVDAAHRLGEETVSTAISYWAVRNGANESIAFSRKPDVNERAVQGLYSVVAELDNKLWAFRREVRNVTRGYIAALNPVQEELYAIVCLVAPTDGQRARAAEIVELIMATCLAQNKHAYFKVGENKFMISVPAGRTFHGADGNTKNRTAVLEVAANIEVNHRALSARYEGLAHGCVTMAAYAAACMFRLGAQESYEHKEYIVVEALYVSDERLTVLGVKHPDGYVVPDFIAVGRDIDISRTRISPRCVELGNMLVATAGTMHYLYNHTTGGPIATGTLLSVLSMYKIVHGTMTPDDMTKITSLMYEVLHPVNKRAMANIMFPKSVVITHGKGSYAIGTSKFELDAFAQIRTNPYPAGSHKAYLCMLGLKRVIQAGLAPFLPWADELDHVIHLCQDTLTCGARAHIGSAYYTGEPPLVQSSALDMYIPDIAMYIHTFNKNDSIAMSPHFSQEVSHRSGMNWTSLCRALKAADVSNTTIDVVRRFLTTGGAVHFTFNPADETTWAPANEDARVALRAIERILE